MRDRKTQTFVKYHSLGNDFVLFDWRGKNADAVMATVQDASWAPYVRQICQQHFGVGANGVLVVMPQNEFLIFNEDGSQAESCLNGLRCVADYLITNGSIQIRMGQRLCICSLSDGEIVSDVGPVEILGEERLSIARKVLSGYSISVGNPHFVIMKKTTAAWLARHGQSLERHELFPQRTNVEFVWAAEDPFSYHVLVYERGCGMTLACGSGAAAITGLFHRQGLIADGQKIALKMAGGTLSTWVEPSGHVMLSARAQKVFIGTVRFD